MSIIDVVRDGLFVLNDYEAMPQGFAQTEEEANRKVNFSPTNPEDVVVFSGSVSDLKSQENLVTVADAIRTLYTDTGLNNFEPIQRSKIISASEEDSAKNIVLALENNKTIGPELGGILDG